MRYVLITGATSGIGEAFSQIFAAKGYGIIMVSSCEKRLRKSKRKLKAMYHKAEIRTLEEDLSIEGAAQRVYEKVHAMNIDIDVLINNAGFGLIGSEEQIEFQNEENMLYLNMVTPTFLCKLFLKDMYERGAGNILNVSSVGAFQPGPYTSAYYASKSYLYSYTLGIRYEAKKYGVNVSVLCPGTTRTQFFRKTGKKTPVWAASPQSVANYAVRCMMKKKAVIIPGILNKVMKIVPAAVKTAGVAILKR